MKEIKNLAGALSFGAIYTGWVLCLIISSCVASFALMISMCILALVIDYELFLIAAVSALFAIPFLVVMVINFVNCAKIKKWAKNAVKLKAFARAIDISTTHTPVFRQRTTKLSVSFKYNNKTVIKESGKRGGAFSSINGYSALFNKYADKELTILYSPIYDEVILMKSL